MPLGLSIIGSTVTFDIFLRWATQGPLGPLVCVSYILYLCYIWYFSVISLCLHLTPNYPSRLGYIWWLFVSRCCCFLPHFQKKDGQYWLAPWYYLLLELITWHLKQIWIVWWMTVECLKTIKSGHKMNMRICNNLLLLASYVFIFWLNYRLIYNIIVFIWNYDMSVYKYVASLVPRSRMFTN